MIRILYLDDEPAILEIGKEFLEKDGEIVVDITTTGEEAISLISQVTYDGIVSDYLMPDIDGIEFLRRVRNTNQKIPFIFFTGKANQEVVIHAINNGADFFLLKHHGDVSSQYLELSQLIKQGAARYHAEQKLKENEEMFRTIVDNTSDWEYWLSPEGSIIYMSLSCEQITGYSREEFLADSNLLFDIVSPMDQQVWDAHILQEQPNNVPISVDIRIFHKDGTERWINHACLPIFDDNHEYRGRRVSNRDITEKKLAEQHLRESEESFRYIFENQQPMIIVDAITHQIANINDEAVRLIGLSKEEILGKVCHHFICQADDGKCPISDLNLEVDHSERILLNHKQEQIPIIKTVKPVFLQGKEYFIESFFDITERKRSLEELQFTNTILTTLKESSTSGILVTGNQGEVITYNQKLISIFDCNEEILISGSGYTIHECLINHIDIPKEYQELTSRLYSNPNEIGRLEITLSNDKIISLYSSPMISPDKTLYGRVWYFQDITTHKLNQESIIRLSRDNQIILDNVPAMIWYKDTKNNFLRVNKTGAIWFGMPVVKIEGKSTYDLFPDYADRSYADDLEVITSKKAKSGIIEPITIANGEKRCVKTDKIPMFSDQGEVSGIIVFSTDITDQQKVQQALRVSNKKLHLLSDITRHDILNQIQVLVFYIHELKLTKQEPPVQENLEKIDLAVKNIERQITFTRDYQDIGVSSPIWQDITSTIIKAVRSLRIEPIAVSIEMPDVRVFADPLLEKVFYNLIDNAKRYGKKITRITFSVHHVTDGLVISIEDDGIGIPYDKKKGIFNREYYHNTGFGLNLSREILEITGITIEETGEPGVGAKFEIMVPEGSFQIK